MEERAGFDEADGFCVGKKIESDLRRDAAIEKLIFGGPGVLHGAKVEFLRTRIFVQKHGSDEVRFASVGEGEQWTGSRDHTMALVLTVCSMTDFFGEGVVGVLQGAHHRGVDANVEGLEAIEIASRIQEAVDGFGVGTGGFREAKDGTTGIGHDPRCVGRIVDEA